MKNYNKHDAKLHLIIFLISFAFMFFVLGSVNNLANQDPPEEEPVVDTIIFSEEKSFDTPKIEPVVIFEIEEPVVEVVEPPPQELTEEIIYNYVNDICANYTNVEPALVMSIIWHESRFDHKAINTNHLGLMQISKRWHKDRAERLGVEDFYDPYGNILLGVDYVSELTTTYKDIELVLMLYNMNHKTAFDLNDKGIISKYASSVLQRVEHYKKGE